MRTGSVPTAPDAAPRSPTDGPSSPAESAEGSPLKITASASTLSPSASSTPVARPDSTTTRRTGVPVRISAPRVSARSPDRPRQRRHPAVDMPDARRFRPPDQHQHRRAEPRRAANIGRVSREKLRQPGVRELRLERPGQRRPRAERRQDLRAARPERRRDPQGRRARIAHHRPLERVEQRPRPPRERPELLGGVRTGQRLHPGLRLRHVGHQIETRAVGPEMPREDLRRDQTDVILQPRADALEKLVEDPPHRENRRAGVDRAGRARQPPRLAADKVARLQHRDAEPVAREREGRAEPRYSRSDDDDAPIHLPPQGD